MMNLGGLKATLSLARSVGMQYALLQIGMRSLLTTINVNAPVVMALVCYN